ncbi:hypothetical protein HanRHA438_Chr11g0510741 [Helianthus annuus]|nr:hypothetical protein HanIR_Chr11g0536301 [Helianthus annuus]KAJ0871298.1 hypothetical protein HanRHA438_Chr11g0510741 [Helianthus annuus]
MIVLRVFVQQIDFRSIVYWFVAFFSLFLLLFLRKKKQRNDFELALIVIRHFRMNFWDLGT